MPPTLILCLLLLLPTACRRPSAATSGLPAGRYTETGRAEAADAPVPSPTCVVGHVVDGDTFVCRNRLKVRLLLVDAPERDQPPFGAQSSSALKRLAPAGTLVRLESDVRPLDQFGRTLAYVYLQDGRMVNEEMAREGYVVPLIYPPNVRHVERIRTAVAEARSAGRGLWSVSGFSCTPHDHRRGRC